MTVYDFSPTEKELFKRLYQRELRSKDLGRITWAIADFIKKLKEGNP